MTSAVAWLCRVLQVRFSVPEHHQPIPRPVAYVFFVLVVSKVKPDSEPIQVGLGVYSGVIPQLLSPVAHLHTQRPVSLSVSHGAGHI